MKELEIKIPEGLYKHIEQLVEEGKFESVETFVSHALHRLAELHGFGESIEGKGLSDMMAGQVATKVETKEKEIKTEKPAVKDHDIPHSDLVLESYGSSKFMFEDAIFASCQFAAMKQGNPPISKEEFSKTLNQMEETGVLTQIQQGEKIMWKKNE
ncbi:MAG: hypothetical protein ACFFDS_03955 [Candidatus Thorarchaeota archaeon]